MDKTVDGLEKPRFRPAAVATLRANNVEVSFCGELCTFDFDAAEGAAVERLIADLSAGGLTVAELCARSPNIARKIPPLLEDLDRLRLLVESESRRADGVTSGAQLYREVRRLAERVTDRVAKSDFQRALKDGNATREHLVGYALEYFWIVKAAPGLIAPALATAKLPEERALLQEFLRSELGHDRLLAQALAAVEVSASALEAHQPLAATFTLCASLGVYSRQHPLSFKAVLFLFERAQPSFVDAFDERCRQLGLPEAFYAPLRAHADLNEAHDHEDISRALMALEPVVDRESAVVVKRHVALLIEAMVQQERQILDFYGVERERTRRLFGGA